MGQIMSFLGGSNRPPSDIFIDFENAKPKAGESPTYKSLKEAMQNGRSVLEGVQGCTDMCRGRIPYVAKVCMRAESDSP